MKSTASVTDRPRLLRPFVILASLVLLTSLLTVGQAGSRPAAAESVGAASTIYSNPPTSNPELRTPDIISTSPNHVVAAWRSNRFAGTSDQGDIQYSYSTDGGGTWSAPAYLAQSNATYRYHYVIFFQNGSDLYAYIGRISASPTNPSLCKGFPSDGFPCNGFPPTMIAKKSTDEGHTWSDFTVNLPAGLSEVVVAGRPLKHDSKYLIPFWQFSNGVTGGVQRAAILYSTDLVNWSAGNWVPDPACPHPQELQACLHLQEPQIVVSQDDPGTLVMEARTLATDTSVYTTGAYYQATSTSADGGLTWSDATLDTSVPNYNTKGAFTKDLNGQYLAIYNTAGSSFTVPAVLSRGVLYYKVKKPGHDAWGAGHFLADSPPGPNGDRGTDDYPSYTEYAPGKFLVIWESNMNAIMVKKLDISDAFTGTNENWTSLSEWSVAARGGTVEISPAGSLHLLNANGSVSNVLQSSAPAAADGFVASMTGRVNQYSPFDTTSGVGADMALKVATGTERLMLTIQSDGVYSIVSGATTWSRVLTGANDTATHTWTVTVDPGGTAHLFKDGQDTGATWVLQSTTASPEISQWVTGTSAHPAEATIDSTSVARYVVGSTFDSLTGWTVAPAGGSATISPAGHLQLANANSGTSFVLRATPEMCDPTVEFTGQVDDYGTINISNGQGIALGVKVSTGARRVMLAIQSDGVYSMIKRAPDAGSYWSKVYSHHGDNSTHTWKVVTDSDGLAHLYVDGLDTQATWYLQDGTESVLGATVFSSGISTDLVESHLDSLLVTCTNN